jgi:hypothetical protein
MGGGGSQSPQQGRSPQTFQPRSPGIIQQHWTMALEHAVHVPGGPFQQPPEHVLERPFGDSPVRYREGPLEYEPAVLCLCKKKMGRFVSWREFPGRRFYCCMVSFYDSKSIYFFMILFFCFGSNLLSLFVCIYLGWQKWL